MLLYLSLSVLMSITKEPSVIFYCYVLPEPSTIFVCDSRFCKYLRECYQSELEYDTSEQ